MLGFKYPILLDTDDKDPKYLSPDASALKGGSEYTAQLKRELFEVVGLALEQDSKQVASGESKAWDAQDVSAVMKARAETLEDAERRAVAISLAWDSDFDAWEPKYSRDFDIGNFKDEVSSIVMAGNMNLPDGVSRMVVQKLVERLDRVGSPTNAEEMSALLEEIKGWSPNEFQPATTF
jgi:hypothetical protein